MQTASMITKRFIDFVHSLNNAIADLFLLSHKRVLEPSLACAFNGFVEQVTNQVNSMYKVGRIMLTRCKGYRLFYTCHHDNYSIRNHEEGSYISRFTRRQPIHANITHLLRYLGFPFFHRCDIVASRRTLTYLLLNQDP